MGAPKGHAPTFPADKFPQLAEWAESVEKSLSYMTAQATEDRNTIASLQKQVADLSKALEQGYVSKGKEPLETRPAKDAR